MTSNKMKFFVRTAGYTLIEHKWDEEILEELKVESFDETLRRYKSNWPWHLTSINDKRMLNYRPIDWRLLGRPLKRPINDDDDDEQQQQQQQKHMTEECLLFSTFSAWFEVRIGLKECKFEELLVQPLTKSVLVKKCCFKLVSREWMICLIMLIYRTWPCSSISDMLNLQLFSYIIHPILMKVLMITSKLLMIWMHVFKTWMKKRSALKP